MQQGITLSQHRARLKTFAVQGERIAYLDEGNRDGLPVVLLHGMPTSSFLYRNIVPILASRGFRVIAPDMVGFGASSKPSDAKAYDFALQAERLRALMQSLGLSSWVQVVHDLGGPWTWELAHAHPACLRGLVVMNTTAYRDGFAPPAVMKLAGGTMGGTMAFMMGNRVTGPSQIRSLFKQFMARRDLVTPDLVQGHAVPMQEGTTRAFLAFARGFDWWFQQFDRYSAALRALDIPAATLWGSRDKVLDLRRLTDQFARDLKIPSHRRFEVDAGHFLQEDAPGAVAKHLVDFLEEAMSRH
jgi:haloalkane dehalogenase